MKYRLSKYDAFHTFLQQPVIVDVNFQPTKLCGEEYFLLHSIAF